MRRLLVTVSLATVVSFPSVKEVAAVLQEAYVAAVAQRSPTENPRAVMKKIVTSASRDIKASGVSLAGGWELESAGSCPIVGIGASAGGLEVLEQFLSHVPDGSGLALVLTFVDITAAKMLEARLRAAAKPGKADGARR